VKFQENVSRPGIIEARARYRAVVRRLRNTALERPGVEGKIILKLLLNKQAANMCTGFDWL